MQQTRLSIAVVLACLVVSPTLIALSQDDNDEPDLKMNEVHTVQVSGTIISPTELALSLSVMVAPFKEQLSRAGVAIDHNDYAHIVSPTIEISTTTVHGTKVYAVSMSAHYEEECLLERAQVKLRCELWQQLELLHMFSKPDDVRSYILKSMSSWSKDFISVLRPRPEGAAAAQQPAAPAGGPLGRG